jgi:NADPH:quinone reductase-like Zn-dependent oxidoreductase
VRGVAAGDAVAALANLNGNGGWSANGESGGEGSYAVARHFLTVRKPPSLSFRDSAALPMCFLSAFAGIYGVVQAGDAVYIPGGVGHLAVQMAARALGAGLVISSRQHAAIDRPGTASPAPIPFSIISATTSPPRSRS